MTNAKTNNSGSTLEWLWDNIHKFIEANPGLSAESIGWCACGDSSIVRRLSEGSDITTRKMDMLLGYIQDPRPPKGFYGSLTPVKLKRRKHG
jgi:hypothetical protein